MSITELSVLPRGTRVRIRRDRFPSNPAVIGQKGIVVEHSPYFPHKIEVTLDGDPRIHTFAPEEVEVVSAPPALTPDKVEAKGRLSRP